MGVVLFAVFAAMEILLTVLSCTKHRSLWYRNRALFCGAELMLLLLVILLPVTGQKWRFTGCVMILGIRLARSGITYLIKRRGSAKEKTNAKVIVGAVMSIFLIGFALLPAFIFTGYSGLKTTGQYKVKETQAILIDKSRLEARENDGSNREIPIHFYYPESDAANCPLVLFAHGSFGYYQSNSSLYMELASNGYVVASIDHPYYAFFTKDTKGKTIIVDLAFVQTAVNMQYSSDFTETEEDFNTICEWMSIRTADENFVLDSIKTAKNAGALDEAWYTKSEDARAEILGALEMTDIEKIGLMGHSIGGAAAVQLGRERDDITAVIDIDGTMLGEQISFHNGRIDYNPEPYPIPILSLDSASHWTSYAANGETDYVNKYLLDNAACGREAHFDGTEHMDFTDLPLFAPALAKMLGKGDVDSSEFIPEINSIMLHYFNYYLKGEGEPNKMIINISKIKKDEKERLEIYCHKVSSEITEIVRFVKSIQGQLTGMIEGTQYEIPVSDVFYIEGVDNKVFIYCEKQVYETRQKLYELEEALKEKHFLRVSKSVLLNLMKIKSIKPSLNGRFTAVLQNGEHIIVSRKYVPELKKALKGGKL